MRATTTITRRTRRFVALTAALVVGTTVALAGCAGRQPPSGNAAAQDTGVSGNLVVMTPPAKSTVNSITWDVPEGEPQTIDPFQSADYTPNTINSNLCETLLAIQPNYKITPNLAISWRNPDPLHWVYNLRTDVRFWDGSPMTAEDVAWSMTHNMTSPASLYGYLYGSVASIKATGPAQVTVTLKRPDYLFNSELADYAGVIVEKKFYLEHPKDVGAPNVGVMCTGPFEFRSWTKGDNITVVRNPHYWDHARDPKAKKIVFKFLTDEATITNALLSGELDGVYDPPWSATTQLQSTTEGRLYFGPHESNLTFTYSNPHGAMSNLKLREALQMAIDWNGINLALLHGSGTPLRALMPPSVFGYAKPALQPAYDALPAPQSAQYQKAKQLVAEAGPDAKKPIVMAVADQYSAQQFGTAITDAARRIGLNFTLRVVPSAEYTNYLYDPKTRAGVDMLYTIFWPNIPDALDWLGIAALNGGSFNQYGYTGIDKIYAQAQATKDQAVRAQLMARMMTQLRNQLLPMAPGITYASQVWMNKRITGAPASFDYVYYPWAAYLGGTS